LFSQVCSVFALQQWQNVQIVRAPHRTAPHRTAPHRTFSQQHRLQHHHTNTNIDKRSPV
jgi:hypothetical protein